MDPTVCDFETDFSSQGNALVTSVTRVNSVCFAWVCSCVKFQESNDKTQLIFGSITNLQAKDAAPVEVTGTFLEKLKTILCNLYRLEI